jgi:hypothetical protein
MTVGKDITGNPKTNPGARSWAPVRIGCGLTKPDGRRQADLPIPADSGTLNLKFDGSVVLLFRDERWLPVARPRGKKSSFLRVVIPSRTAHDMQAASYTRWHPDDETILYGFRKLDGKRRCVVAAAEVARGHVLLSGLD